MRIFFDTNVLVSALTFPGVCSDLLTLCFEEYSVILNEYVLGELRETLRNKFGLSWDSAERRTSELRLFATVVADTDIVIDLAIRDPNDVPVYKGAITAGADILVTGDKDLLELEGAAIRICTPRTLLDDLRAFRGNL